MRHPNILRSIVLDGAYPLNGPDYAWYPSYAPAMRDKFDIACRRFAPCARLPGTSIDHMQPLLAGTAVSSLCRARAADSDGKEREFTANASQLAIVMFGSAPAFATVRELDAAARAFIGRRPRAAAAAHGGNHQRRGLARSHRRRDASGAPASRPP